MGRRHLAHLRHDGLVRPDSLRICLSRVTSSLACPDGHERAIGEKEGRPSGPHFNVICSGRHDVERPRVTGWPEPAPPGPDWWLQCGDALGQEGDSPEQRLDQDDGHIGSDEAHRSGEPSTGTDISDSGPGPDIKSGSATTAQFDVSIPYLVGLTGTKEPPLDARTHQDVRILRE